MASSMSSLPRPDAIAFDCYETLFTNERSAWRELFGEIAADYGIAMSGSELYERWKRCEVQFRERRTNLADPARTPPFTSYEQAWSECFQRVFDDIGFAGDANQAGRRSVESLATRSPYPETSEALQRLQGRVKLGIFSNVDEDSLRPLIAGAGVDFDAVASSESARVYKPALAAFGHMLQLLGVDAARTWYVGDQLFDDVLGAHRAGMTTVWINRNGTTADAEPHPDAEITSLLELSTLLDAAH